MHTGSQYMHIGLHFIFIPYGIYCLTANTSFILNFSFIQYNKDLNLHFASHRNAIMT